MRGRGVGGAFSAEFAENFYSVVIGREERRKVNIGYQIGPWWRKHSQRITKAIQTVKRPAPAAVIKFRSFSVRDLYSRWKTNKSWRHRGTIDKNYFLSRVRSDDEKVIVCSHGWPPFASRGKLSRRSWRDLWINLPKTELFSRSRLANRTRFLWKSLKFSWWSFSITLSGK